MIGHRQGGDVPGFGQAEEAAASTRALRAVALQSSEGGLVSRRTARHSRMRAPMCPRFWRGSSNPNPTGRKRSSASGFDFRQHLIDVGGGRPEVRHPVGRIAGSAILSERTLDRPPHPLPRRRAMPLCRLTDACVQADRDEHLTGVCSCTYGAYSCLDPQGRTSNLLSTFHFSLCTLNFLKFALRPASVPA